MHQSCPEPISRLMRACLSRMMPLSRLRALLNRLMPSRSGQNRIFHYFDRLSSPYNLHFRTFHPTFTTYNLKRDRGGDLERFWWISHLVSRLHINFTIHHLLPPFPLYELEARARVLGFWHLHSFLALKSCGLSSLEVGTLILNIYFKLLTIICSKSNQV